MQITTPLNVEINQQIESEFSSVDFLVVGGGGGGGNISIAGGGGSGSAILYLKDYLITKISNLSLVIGLGGNGGETSSSGYNGDDGYFSRATINGVAYEIYPGRYGYGGSSLASSKGDGGNGGSVYDSTYSGGNGGKGGQGIIELYYK